MQITHRTDLLFIFFYYIKISHWLLKNIELTKKNQFQLQKALDMLIKFKNKKKFYSLNITLLYHCTSWTVCLAMTTSRRYIKIQFQYLKLFLFGGSSFLLHSPNKWLSSLVFFLYCAEDNLLNLSVFSVHIYQSPANNFEKRAHVIFSNIRRMCVCVSGKISS